MDRPLAPICVLVLLLVVMGPRALSASPSEHVMHTFGHAGDGAIPNGGLTPDASGSLYGVTAEGGSSNAGTVYQLVPSVFPDGIWRETVLYNFVGDGVNGDGERPAGDLVLDGLGNLYGVTNQGGGALGQGTVFELSPPAQPGGSWTETVLHIFTDISDGALPNAGLVFDGAGNLFGTTLDGGAANKGVVFELSPPAQPGGVWTESLLYEFQGGSDGAFPMGKLVFDPNGNLYGTTNQGGGHFNCNNGRIDCGTIFELSPPSQSGGAWSESQLHVFRGSDGALPQAGLVMNSAGALAGTASTGGLHSLGVVFGLEPSQSGGAWKFVILHNFSGQPTDGAIPEAGLTLGEGDTVFGTTARGGASDHGTIFQLTHAGCCGWSETVYSFLGAGYGATPAATVTLLHSELYGTTVSGGFRQNLGIAFRVGR